MQAALLYVAGVITCIWGIAHLFPTRSVVKGFGDISEDNKQIITMEWINEGVAMIFIGLLVGSTTYIQPIGELSSAIYILSFIGLIALAIISLFTGYKVNFIPFKMCPYIFTSSAILIYFGAFLL